MLDPGAAHPGAGGFEGVDGGRPGPALRRHRGEARGVGGGVGAADGDRRDQHPPGHAEGDAAGGAVAGAASGRRAGGCVSHSVTADGAARGDQGRSAVRGDRRRLDRREGHAGSADGSDARRRIRDTGSIVTRATPRRSISPRWRGIGDTLPRAHRRSFRPAARCSIRCDRELRSADVVRSRERRSSRLRRCLRQGRVDAAIAEYTRIVEAQPRDWNSANALGDLYVHVEAGRQGHRAVHPHRRPPGRGRLLPKAAALYKKILKFKPDEEYALLQSAEIAAKQGTCSDAKTVFRAVAERRRTHGDNKGAAEIDDSHRPARSRGSRGPSRRRAGRPLEIKDNATALARVPRGRRQTRQEQGRGERGAAGISLAFDLNPNDWEVREPSSSTRYLAVAAISRAATRRGRRSRRS